ncbi:MAG TPA: sulfatase-like hydrolase/transferase [Chthoniobacterales bacterium]
MSPRNILLLMADELRFDLPGFMGNPIARTPTLDRLARGAVVFDNAYTPSPVCVPARQCIATGKYPLHTGCERFGEDLPPGARTFARTFSEAGYLTVACGKLHHRGPDQMQGWLQRIGAETAVQWPNTFGAEGREQIGRLKWRGVEELEIAGPGTSPLSLHDRHTVDGAIDFLRMHFEGMYRRTADIPPLLLMVSLQQPHFPLLADADLFAHYHDIVRPRLREEAPWHPVLGRNALPCGEQVTPAQVRNATAAYYALVEKTDQEFGRVLAALESHGQNLDDWLIVGLSDHGDMLGEHALWEKRRFYEGSARVPLFLRAPDLWPAARRRENVSTIDLFPTLCAVAGLDTPDDLDARSLVPLLEGRREGWLNDTFCQLDLDEFMLKRGNLKYLTFGEKGPDVLFDLASDPGETTNRIADDNYFARGMEMRDDLMAFIATRRGGADLSATSRN